MSERLSGQREEIVPMALMQTFTKIVHFFEEDIWRLRSKNLPRLKSIGLVQLRIFILAWKGFLKDRCQLRASALTFYSLLSIVPVFAMAFGIAKGFGFEQKLRNKIYESFAAQEEVMHRLIEFSDAMLANTQGGLVAGVGIIVLFLTVIKLLANIEASFNDIWGVKKLRSFGRRFTDYLSIILVCPILVVVSSSVTVLISSQISNLLNSYESFAIFNQAFGLALGLTPLVAIVGAFCFMYVFMPNTKVPLRSALIGAIVAGVGYQITQSLYIQFQINVSQVSAIYGSFAALPLFLIWLQLSWLIVLFGAEISFAEQHVHTYEFEPDALQASQRLKRLLSLQIAHEVAKRFQNEESPAQASDFSRKFEVPIRLIHSVLFDLTEAKILVEIPSEEGDNSTYLPAISLDALTVHRVLVSLDKAGSNNIPFQHDSVTEKLENIQSQFSKTLESSDYNVPLKDLA